MLTISGSQKNEVRKDLLRLVTVNVGSLSGRSREIVDMFERRRLDIGRLQDVCTRAKEPEYTEVTKSTTFSGTDQEGKNERFFMPLSICSPTG